MPMPQLMKNRILARDPEFGGITLLITGALGTGKTSFLCAVAKRLLEMQKEGKHPKEYLFWRGDVPCQWVKFLDHNPPIDCKIFVPKSKRVNFYGDIDFQLERDEFSSYNDLMKKAELGKVNVVYLDDYELIEFMTFMQRRSFDWNSVFIDECETLAPYGASGKKYASAQKFSHVLREARKFRMSVYANTQAASDIYWFALSKFRAYAFLEGARTLKFTPIWKSAIQALRLGEAWVSTGGLYEKVKFPPFVSKRDVRAEILEEGIES